MAQSPYQQLEDEFRRLNALESAVSLLRWDAAVMMPRGSADLRGDQLAALETECHALLVSPRTARLLDRAEANAQGLDAWQQANVREMRRAVDRALATPQALVSRLAKATARAEARWAEARRQQDFAAFAPSLAEVVELTRDKADLLGQALGLPAYDALVDGFSPGLSGADIERIFAALGRRLPGLIQKAMTVQADRQPLPVTGRHPPARQRLLAVEVMRTLGFPFDRGRLDESEHPFTGGVPGDVRVTTRFDAADPLPGLMGILHECGHALYDCGLPQAWQGQPVGRDRGMAMQESQSLLLEMVIGRSRPFIEWLAPLLRRVLGVDGPEWTSENLYRLLTRVRRGMIRVDADELTYPLHVMLRFDLERALFAGEIGVADLPDAWNAGMERRLGLTPGNAAEGCLQDVHWAVGSFGYFPSYVLGAVIAGQLYERLRSDRPGLDAELAAGQFAGLFGWLGENVHALGASVGMSDLVRNCTGRPLSAAPWLRYVEAKYLE